jgi:hypothetical protein
MATAVILVTANGPSFMLAVRVSPARTTPTRSSGGSSPEGNTVVEALKLLGPGFRLVPLEENSPYVKPMAALYDFNGKEAPLRG